jgi:hypothetical protein
LAVNLLPRSSWERQSPDWRFLRASLLDALFLLRVLAVNLLGGNLLPHNAKGRRRDPLSRPPPSVLLSPPPYWIAIFLTGLHCKYPSCGSLPTSGNA